MTWQTIAGGTSIGGEGTENGTILRDEEYNQRARITLEKDGKSAPFSITCSVYGWMFHTRHFFSLLQAVNEYEKMKSALSDILSPQTDRPPAGAENASITAAIAEFVRRFP